MRQVDQDSRLFISYNSESSEFVRSLAAALTLTGAQVWLDKWRIRPGDSIPSAIDAGLSGFDTFVLVWSKGAEGSNWVRNEMNAAITRWTKEQHYRFVPVLLDDTPVPTILAPIHYIDAKDEDHFRVARVLLGVETDAEFRKAIQEVIESTLLPFREFHGAGVYVCCPKCGLPADQLKQWSAPDPKRDDMYAGVECPECRWSDGGEVPW
ncbi:MAG: toll/interleukin-1 receptor domain-containing protein [Chthonomonas sp.]|nr:toll/interleukin-1 receptor domain-containing protein [Chthonomonas sp.]